MIPMIPHPPYLVLVPPATVSVCEEPRVFNANFVARLASLNAALRRIRTLGVVPTALHLQGARPAIHVDQRAATALIAEGAGYNATVVGDGLRLCKVILEECDITWYEGRAS